jgi:hypothetical protein
MMEERFERPERFELPTFWFVGGLWALRGSTAANNTQRNQRKAPWDLGSHWTALYPVRGQSHGQFAPLHRGASVRTLPRFNDRDDCANASHLGHLIYFEPYFESLFQSAAKGQVAHRVPLGDVRCFRL